MKYLSLFLLVSTLSSCTVQDSSNVKRIAVAGGVGYLTGGKAGAISAAAAEFGRTSAKSPRNIQP
jgi:tRNA A37 threonylcarbamoyladenosine modification protein TsaB